MARTRSLANLRADVCFAADIADGGAGGRFPSANLNRRINQAIQEFTRLVTEAGCDIYIKQATATTSTSSTVDATNWAPRDYLALPADFYHLKGIDISPSGSTVVPMLDFMMVEQNLFKWQPVWLASAGTGMPVFYKVGGVNAAGSRLVKIIPSADSTYACAIWYLAVPPDLVADSDTFDGIAGYEDWIVNRAACDCLSRNGTSPLYQALMQENAVLQAKMAKEFATTAGPGRRLDMRAMRAKLAAYVRGDWRAV